VRVDAFLAWSSFVFGLAGFVAAIDGMRRTLRERKRGDRMADALSARSEPHANPLAARPSRDTGEVRAPTSERARIRSFLVHAAAGNQPMAVAIARAKRLGVSESDVLALADESRRSGLLDYDDPVGSSSVLSLRQ
jgi:hypothetical protein